MNEKIVVISGTTASGKSELALLLAKEFNGYIINADSRQIYKELKVGTAQPKPGKVSNKGVWEIGGVNHHLFGFISIEDDYNIHRYQKDVEEVLRANSGIPFLVGGTGLYIDSVVYNYDIDSSSKSAPKNHLYLYIDVTKESLDLLIRQRIEKMFERGLMEELEYLWEKYPGFNLKPLKSIGYAEFVEYFNGDADLEQVKERIFLHTRQYAKRQRTWFKRNENVTRVKSIKEAKEAISKFL